MNPLPRSEEHTSELQSLRQLVCRLLLEKKRRELLAHRRTRKLLLKVLCQAARLLRWTLGFGLFVVTRCSSGPLLSTRISAGAVRSITLSFAAESGANSSAM